MNTNVRPVRGKDSVPFHCTCCGACCRDIEDRLMLEPLDAYHLGRHLTAHGTGVQDVDDVYAEYAHPIMLDGLLPIFVLNTKGKDHSCVFLQDDRCTVYDARPRVCRLYPFTVKTGERGKKFECCQCLDQHAGHFNGGRVKVSDWMYQNFSKEVREFVEAEAATLPELGLLLRQLDSKEQEAVLFHLLFYRYYNYDLAEPFLPQYRRNHQALLTELRRRAEEKEQM